MTKERAVLVTTKHRGVFFGYLKKQEGTTVTLTTCRNAIRFGTTKGFLELANTGPTSNSKIGSVASAVELYDITSIAEVTPEAESKWLEA